ncbi:MAG: hypothetical protein OEY22_01645 [Candidatus Bathyarchaeota archaeon]|nr:hypothetical protein [Candidatus Bathyarchaeota archaeon]MDH5788222.1 hypothetical protein [Candidatus Bathyarchaeota archaeon]
MSDDLNGKLLVYASAFASSESRMKSVSAATEKMAKILNLNVEVVTFTERLELIYVYYKNGEEEPIPIYCNKGEKSSTQEVCAALRKMMFVMSFHPKHSALKRIRREIMRFS